MSLLTTTSDLAAFQSQFGNYLRRQNHTDGDSVPKRVGTLYQSLIFNNLSGFVNQCFPVCQSIISDDTWQALLRAFLQHGTMSSPYFSEINEQFVQYLQSSDIINALSLPPFFAELAHYEWIELYVDNLPNQMPTPFLRVPSLAINPSVQALYYTWAVQDISGAYLPAEPTETFLLVYRQQVQGEYQSAFMHINALTFFLIQFIQDSTKPFDDTHALLSCFADHFGLSHDFDTIADALFATMMDNQVFLPH